MSIQAAGTILQPDKVVSGAKFCVGQKIDLAPAWDSERPEIQASNNVQWTLPGQFITTNLPAVNPQASSTYTNDPQWLKFETTRAWWYDGKYDPAPLTASFKEDLVFKNGQTATVSANGMFSMHRPKVSLHKIYPHTFTAWALPLFYIGLEVGSNGPNHELDMNFTIEVDSNCVGQGGIKQLCSLNFSNPLGRATNELDNVEWYTDPCEIFPGGIAGNTGHEGRVLIDIDDGPGCSGYQTVRVEGAYVDYVMFRPGMDTAENIYVTLGVANWNVLGVASYHSLSIETDSNTINGPFGPDDSNKFPVWTKKFVNH